MSIKTTIIPAIVTLALAFTANVHATEAAGSAGVGSRGGDRGPEMGKGARTEASVHYLQSRYGNKNWPCMKQGTRTSCKVTEGRPADPNHAINRMRVRK